MAVLATHENQTSYCIEDVPVGENIEAKSFDLTANIRMLRYDQDNFGDVLPETRERIHDELLSLLVEGMDRAHRTPFTIRRDAEGNLVYFDKGNWRPYLGMLLTGLEVAKSEATDDFRKHFKVEWAENDIQKGFAMQALKPGQRLSWYNSYPHHIEDEYGEAFANESGLNSARRMGFLYQAICDQDGSLSLYTQTVDRSDPAAFAAVEAMLEFDPDADLDTMLRTYDGTLVKQYGGEFYAGRRGVDKQENAWEDLLQHKNIIEYYLHSIEELAASDMVADELEEAVKRLTYGVWAALKYRIEDGVWSEEQSVGDGYNLHDEAAYQYLAYEVQASYERAQAAHEEFISCGGSVSAANNQTSFLSMSPMKVFDSLFGEAAKSLLGNSSESSYKFDNYMYCVVCQAPPTESEKKSEAKKMCGPCGICKKCDTKIRQKSQSDFALAA